MMVNKGFEVQDIRKDIEFKVKSESFNRRCKTHKWEHVKMRKLKMEMKSDCVTAMVQDKVHNEGARQRSKVYRETIAQAS